jgi:phage shock protein PspC (stress-responsive transcriptional regulator)
MSNSNLYRSKTNTVIGGVCGGLGNYLNVDPILFRVLFVLAFLIGGSGLLVYIILWIVIPEEKIVINDTNLNNNSMDNEMNNTDQQTNSGNNQNKPQKNDGNLWGGLILITLGGIFLIDRFVPRIDFGDLWPLILIVVGIILITKAYQQPKN